MAKLTKQTTLILNRVDPDFITAPGGIDPMRFTTDESDAFVDMMTEMFITDKTDAVQYSTTIGTSIRRWVDQESAEFFINWVIANMWDPHGITAEEYSYEITDL
jgi:hypothetical protein